MNKMVRGVYVLGSPYQSYRLATNASTLSMLQAAISTILLKVNFNMKLYQTIYINLINNKLQTLKYDH